VPQRTLVGRRRDQLTKAPDYGLSIRGRGQPLLVLPPTRIVVAVSSDAKAWRRAKAAGRLARRSPLALEAGGAAAMLLRAVGHGADKYRGGRGRTRSGCSAHRPDCLARVNSEMSTQIIPLKDRTDLRECSRILALETIRVSAAALGRRSSSADIPGSGSLKPSRQIA
jgi:hypothetical protein